MIGTTILNGDDLNGKRSNSLNCVSPKEDIRSKLKNKLDLSEINKIKNILN